MRRDALVDCGSNPGTASHAGKSTPPTSDTVGRTATAAKSGEAAAPVDRPGAPLWLLWTLAATASWACEGRDGPGGPDPRSANCVIETERAVDLGDLQDPVSVGSPFYNVVHSLSGGGWLVFQSNRPSAAVLYREDGSFDGVSVHRGDGPLEVGLPFVVARAPGDSLWMSDDRGKFLVLDPTGRPIRSVRSRPLTKRINAFDTRGYAASRRTRRIDDTLTVAYATIWNPSGDSVRVLGPGGERRVRTYPSVGTVGQGLILENDSVAYAATSQDPSNMAWVEKWTSATTQPLVLRQAVWRIVDPHGQMAPPDSGRATAIMRDAQARIWGISFWNPTRETQGFTTELFRSLLWVADTSGHVLAARHLPSLAWGFPDAGHFYTYREEPSGLLVIEIHAQRLRCNQPLTRDQR